MLIPEVYLLSQTDVVCKSYHTLIVFSNSEKVKGLKKVNDDISMTSPTTPHDANLDQWQCDKWQQLTGQMWMADPIRI
jgi:hypothetical protein